jgi:hypothetical protein
MKSALIRTTTVLLSLVLLAATAQGAGYYYEARTVTQGEKQKQRDEMKVKAWVDGPKAKIEFVTTGQKKGMFSDGSYLLTKDAGETVYLVDPKEKTYAEFDLEQMMAAAGQAMAMLEQMGGMFQMEFTDVYNEKLSEGSGGSVLGYDTTHYRYKSGYTMKLGMMGFKQQNRVDMIQDLWCTDHFDAAGFGVWLRPDRALKTGNEEFDKLINSQMAKVKGFPLKAVNVSTTTNKKGKAVQHTSTTEVTTLREESVADATFEVPAGYTETQIVPEMEGYDQQGDQEGKKKQTGLSGLFKKPKNDG